MDDKLLEIFNVISLAFRWETSYLESGNYWHMIWAEQYKAEAKKLIDEL